MPSAGSETPRASWPATYYAVIFVSRRTAADDAGYAAMSARMAELAAQQPGYLGVDSARGDDGLGITVSYWESRAAIDAWRAQEEHLLAQNAGRETWYAAYELHVAKVERHRLFEKEALNPPHRPAPA